MRNIQQDNQNKQVLDRKTRCWSRLEEYAKVQKSHSKKVDCPKVAGSCGPPASVALTASHQLLEKRTSDNSDLILRPRQVVLQTSSVNKDKRSNGRTLVKSNSLPPIYDSRASSLHGGKTWVPDRLVDREVPQVSKKGNISTISLRRNRTLIWRQKDCHRLASTVNVICSSLATFCVTENMQNVESYGVKVSSQSSLGNSSRYLSLNENDPNAKDSGFIITEGINDSASVSEIKQHREQLSDSAIETETQSSHKNKGTGEVSKIAVLDDQEEEYYTTQKIAEWIIGVNTSLFSPLKDELNKVLLKEEDVDTIKIVYGQD